MKFRRSPTGNKAWSASGRGIRAEIYMDGAGKYHWKVYEYRPPHHSESGVENSRNYAEIKIDTFYDEHKSHAAT